MQRKGKGQKVTYKDEYNKKLNKQNAVWVKFTNSFECGQRNWTSQLQKFTTEIMCTVVKYLLKGDGAKASSEIRGP
jgi:hypothetical protein